MSENGKYDPTDISSDGSLVDALNKWQLGLQKSLNEISDDNYEAHLERLGRVAKAATLHYNLAISEGKLRKTIKIRRSILEPAAPSAKPKKTHTRTKKASLAGLSKVEKQVRAIMNLGFTEEQAKTKMKEMGIEI